MNRFMILAGILLLGFSFTSIADVTISGNARVRARVDMKTYDDNSDEASVSQKKSTDGYALYRARINVKADVNEDFYFQAQLSSNTPTNWNKMGSGSGASDSSHGSGSTASADFTNLFLGYEGNNLSFKAGKVPMKGNALLDAHYYPNAPFDIQYAILNNAAFTGFSAGYKINDSSKIDAFLSVNINSTPTSYEGDDKVDVESKDSLSIGASYGLALSNLNLTLRPTGILSLSAVDSDGNTSPLRFTGGLFADYKVSEKIKLNAGVGYSMSTVVEKGDGKFLQPSHESTNSIIAHVGLKAKGVGPGTLKTFLDYAKLSDEPWTDEKFGAAVDYSTLYFHAQYGIPLASNGKRSASIIPAIRYLVRSADNDTQGYQPNKSDSFDSFNRLKVEVNFEVKF